MTTQNIDVAQNKTPTMVMTVKKPNDPVAGEYPCTGAAKRRAAKRNTEILTAILS
jgi:hypothetical protein